MPGTTTGSSPGEAANNTRKLLSSNDLVAFLFSFLWFAGTLWGQFQLNPSLCHTGVLRSFAVYVRAGVSL